MSKNIQFQEWETASWPSLAALFLGDYCSAAVQYRLRFCSHSKTPHTKKRNNRARERAVTPNEINTEEQRVFTRKPRLFLPSVLDRYLPISAKA